jgi:5'-nucleotidase/UDP-sugar diphosphatase
MGRETKILLALLGLLVGVFLGVVSMKLFVPRPPAGAGPDVHADIATVEAQALVEPPEFDPPPATAADIATMPIAAPPAESLPADDPYAGRTSRFGTDAPAAAGPRDPFVTQASFAAEPAAADLPPQAVDLPLPAAEPSAPELLPFRRAQPTIDDLGVPPGHIQPPPPAVSDVYLAQPGDSWWSLAERAYGDGRLYRALFAWNRAIDPRVSLAPGTRLEIPPAAKLGATWPGLLPRD